MPALAAGAAAPEISLPLLNGGKFSLAEALKKGPVLAAFFKVSCPVCQLAFPFLQRIYAAYAGANVTVVGISQDAAQDTTNFNKEFGIAFPIALDDIKSYPASNAYQLTNVPTMYWISTGKRIEIASVGWSRQEVEELNTRVAAAAKKPAARLFKPGEDVPELKAG
jgi:peroxiredoxin